MADNGLLKRYLDAGIAFTQMTRERAEEIIRDFVRRGDVQREQTEQWVDELVDRSRQNTQHLMAMVRREVTEQLRALGITGDRAPSGTKPSGTKKASPSAK